MTATNFDEYVLAIADEAPHAVILDWYRRLELMMRDYVESRGLSFHAAVQAERIIATNSVLGAKVSNEIAALRRVRNKVAHGSPTVAPEDAYVFARRALDLIGSLWNARDLHAA